MSNRTHFLLAMPMLACLACGWDARASDLMDPTPTAKAPVGVLERKRPYYDPVGYRSGNFIFFPSLLTSATFDDNIFATNRNRISDMVFHIVPTVLATGDFGKTAVSGYITADARILTQRSSLSAVSPGVGIGARTEIQRDLTAQGQLDYAYRVEDPGDINSINRVGVQTRDNVRYHDFTASASLNKSFNSFFLSTGMAYEHLAYQDVQDTNGNVIAEHLRDADLATWTIRGGYQIGPGLRLFAEPSYNIRRYASSLFDSDGWRLVGGVSSEIGRLVTGEIYAGYIQRDYRATFGSIGGFTAGGNLRWFPTDLLTLSLQADRSIQDASVTSGINQGSPAFITTLATRADYELFRNLILSGRAGYQNLDYQRNTTRRDNLYYAGLTASYLFNRFLSGSLDYRYTINDSNVANGSFTRNQVTVSVKGQF